MSNVTFFSIKPWKIPTDDDGFKYGWHCGFKWIKENYHIDEHGNPNCKGDFLKHFQDLSGNEIIGVKEGVTYGLSFFIRSTIKRIIQMSNRLDQEIEKKLQPLRMEVAKQAIQNLNLPITQIDDVKIIFTFKDHPVTYYPYSGWAAGRSIRDGRGLENLLKQLK